MRSVLTLLATIILTSQSQSGKPRAPQPPRVNVSCVMTNHPYEVVHFVHFDKKELKPEEHDDFWIGGHDENDRGGCTITVDGKVIYKAPLTTGHPTSSRDAMQAIDSFRNVRAMQIVREYKK